MRTDKREDANRDPQLVTVSVVIPVKDDAEELAACLSALKAQTRPAEEIVVVDNASSDSSASIARAAGATVIECLQPGIPAASARGYDAASGDLILRLDADCVPAASWIHDVVAAFEDRPEVSALTGPARFIDGPVLLRRPLAALYLHSYTCFCASALGHRPLFGSNLAMRRQAWEEIRADVHRDDPEVHDDLDLSFHLGERHRLGYVRGEPMGISMRPFSDARAFRRRMARGFRTVAVHWPEDFPPYRWRRARQQRREISSAAEGRSDDRP
ncbi:glycosyltransferase family 2 protein [Nesterenkonia lutea]|uniref:4,4'-diaponeurosporenoate glycosyltransferase n=1 Tax=Nesterenkonia lutea TaxID=272919 RepID=A0ABR9JC93_9MICC|nr:glycosyltransferase family 2 protein [Nesterenkonia lutea]MBE1523540.1 glycosyltransferase involved in cell wall biosynthesis [Nesterenkonia lutea]